MVWEGGSREALPFGVNDGLMEQLLREGESSSLDYKRDRYPFAGVTDDEKGELLKDILAFANGWRHAEVYILIGVEEVVGGRSTVVGVSHHIPENVLQQFVNSKTNRPVTFSYRSFPFEGKQVGVITIPQQDRPLYLIRNFGRLQKHVVYYRQGTTTAIAFPDDFARMGMSAEIEKVLEGQSEDARKFQHALSLGALQAEPHPDGSMALFRLEVRNNDGHRTIDDVCIRTVSLVRVDGSDDHERLQIARPLLAITGSGQMPSNPPETRRNLAASDSLLFDFVRVYCDRRGGHTLCYGECVKIIPSCFRAVSGGDWRMMRSFDQESTRSRSRCKDEMYSRFASSSFSGGIRQGHIALMRLILRRRAPYLFCFAPTEFDTLPPNMHPHQLRALVTELRKPAYDGMPADEVYRKLDDDVPMMCGLSQVRFVTAGALENTPLKPGKWAVIISDEELASFPGGIPGFPNAIRPSDFDIAWQTARGS